MMFQLPECLRGDSTGQAGRYLDTYYGKPDARNPNREPYAGAYFDSWARGQEDPNRFTADDLIAVSFLSVVVPPLAARELLDRRATEFNNLLADVGPDRDLAYESDPVTEGQAASQLYHAVKALHGVGRTITSKLLARKRPRLIPIYDSVVARVSVIGDFHWEPLRDALRRDGLQQRLELLRDDAGLPQDTSALRVLDVVTWMEGKAEGVRPTAPEERLGAALTEGLTD
jgi:hypothetical protein